MNNNKSLNKKIPSIEIVPKESKKKKFLRLGALLGAVLMFGTCLISLIMYIL